MNLSSALSFVNLRLTSCIIEFAHAFDMCYDMFDIPHIPSLNLIKGERNMPEIHSELHGQDVHAHPRGQPQNAKYLHRRMA